MSNLVFSAAARDRWITLSRNNGPNEHLMSQRVHAVLDRLDRQPARHQVGATQFRTQPSTWGQLVSPDADHPGADWLIIWTTTPDMKIYILRIEPAPAMGQSARPPY